MRRLNLMIAFLVMITSTIGITGCLTGNAQNTGDYPTTNPVVQKDAVDVVHDLAEGAHNLTTQPVVQTAAGFFGPWGNVALLGLSVILSGVAAATTKKTHKIAAKNARPNAP